VLERGLEQLKRRREIAGAQSCCNFADWISAALREKRKNGETD
jgi:hypothetical protein